MINMTANTAVTTTILIHVEAQNEQYCPEPTMTRAPFRGESDMLGRLLRGDSAGTVAPSTPHDLVLDR